MGGGDRAARGPWWQPLPKVGFSKPALQQGSSRDHSAHSWGWALGTRQAQLPMLAKGLGQRSRPGALVPGAGEGVLELRAPKTLWEVAWATGLPAHLSRPEPRSGPWGDQKDGCPRRQ